MGEVEHYLPEAPRPLPLTTCFEVITLLPFIAIDQSHLFLMFRLCTLLWLAYITHSYVYDMHPFC